MKVGDFEANERYRLFNRNKPTLTVHFLPFDTPIRKNWYFALSGIRTHVSLYTFHLPRNLLLSCVQNPVWGYRGKDTLSSEEKLGPWDPPRC